MPFTAFARQMTTHPFFLSSLQSHSLLFAVTLPRLSARRLCPATTSTNPPFFRFPKAQSPSVITKWLHSWVYR